MAGSRSPWRALRPVFLAGAATLTWLTLSASAASADTLQDPASLLGGVTNPVSSVTEKLHSSEAGLAHAAVTPGPAAGSSSGLLQPVAEGVSEFADPIISSIPVVNYVVPAETVSVIAVPVAESADAATAEAIDVGVQPVVELLPVLEPVMQPVADVITGTQELPLPELPAALRDAVHAGTAPVAVGVMTGVDPAASRGNAAFLEAATTGIFDAPSAIAAPVLADAAIPFMPQRHAMVATFPEGQPGTSAPNPVLPSPGSGTGSAAVSAASSGTAAWLSPYDLNLPLAGLVLASEASEHAPAPVSFDPGSSPD